VVGLRSVQKLGNRLNATDPQPIASAGASNVQKLPLRFIDVVQFHLIGHRFDVRLERQDFVVTGITATALNSKSAVETSWLAKYLKCRGRVYERLSLQIAD
jgi:hypothetical protein